MEFLEPHATSAPLPSLVIPSVATIKASEEATKRFFSDFGEPSAMVLDLSRSEYIEVASLVYFIASIKARLKQNHSTFIKIPASKNVRDFLRVWRFPEAVEEITNKEFINLVVEEDRHYFGENKKLSDIKYANTTVLDDKVERLLSDRFFALTTFHLKGNRDDTRLVFDETGRWDGQLIKAVLRKHLAGPEGYFASRIIFESLTNALRHPKARTIQIASRFDFSAKDPAKGHFTIVFWDDGDSIIDTLKTAIETGKRVRAREFPELYKNYGVIIEDESEQRQPITSIPSSFIPTPGTLDELIFLAATFPGVTRDIEGLDHISTEETKQESSTLAAPGMGLYVLTNCVADIFGGSIAFRTKRHFMNIKRATRGEKKEGFDYRVKISRYGSTMPDFLGNMLTIRLPTHEKHKTE
jgi:hypothetical protein